MLKVYLSISEDRGFLQQQLCCGCAHGHHRGSLHQSSRPVLFLQPHPREVPTPTLPQPLRQSLPQSLPQSQPFAHGGKEGKERKGGQREGSEEVRGGAPLD